MEGRKTTDQQNPPSLRQGSRLHEPIIHTHVTSVNYNIVSIYKSFGVFIEIPVFFV